MKKRYGVLVALFSILLLSPVSSDPADTANGAEAAVFEIREAAAPPMTLWFVSNEMGQALKSAYSLTALREPYALSVMPVAGEFIPDEYRADYEAGWKAECRTLYEEGALLRIQWVFFDSGGVVRFVAAKSPEGAGFTEVYNERGLLIRESRFDAPVFIEEETTEEETGEANEVVNGEANEDGEPVVTESAPSEMTAPSEKAATSEKAVPSTEAAVSMKVVESVPVVITYSYRDDFLIGAKSDEWSDVYRYARNNHLRVIERTYLATKTQTRVDLPRTIEGLSFNGDFFVAPVSAYTSSFLQDVLTNTGKDTVYTLDEKGRILTETRHGEGGETIGTLTNVWDADRIVSVVWDNKDDSRRIDYTYDDDGECIGEKNYRGETLEREVAIDGNTNEEIETLYLKGEPVLRAVWQDGRKVKEEALRGTDHAPVSRRRRS